MEMEDEISGASDFRDLPLMPACPPALFIYLFMHRIEVILWRCVYVRIFCTCARALALALALALAPLKDLGLVFFRFHHLNYERASLSLCTPFSPHFLFSFTYPSGFHIISVSIFYYILHMGKFCRVNGNHALMIETMDSSPNTYLNSFFS